MLTRSDSSQISNKVERGKYARICVELDLQKKLVSRIIAIHAAYHVEYEGLNLIYFACGRYGHQRESCPWTYTKSSQEGSQHQTNPTKVVKPSMPAARPPSSDEEFENWMIVGRSSKSQYAGKSYTSGAKREQGKEAAFVRKTHNVGQHSRFSVFTDLVEEEPFVTEDR